MRMDAVEMAAMLTMRAVDGGNLGFSLTVDQREIPHKCIKP